MIARLAGVAALLAGVAACAGITACGGGAPAPAHPAHPAPTDSGSGTRADAGAPAPDLLPSTAALAARGPTDAPLMREVQRVEQAAPRAPDLRAERDLCVRAVFAASAPVKAWFADQSGAARGEISAAAAGTVPPRGPACLKKGESVHLVVEGAGPISARAVVFAAP